DLVPQVQALRDGAGSVVGETGLDLDGYPAVNPVARVIDGTQDVASGRHVVGGDLEHRLGDGLALGGQLGHLGVVGVALGQCPGEDGRVSGDTDNVPVVDELLQSAGGDAVTGQIVEPDADSSGREGCEGTCAVHGGSLSCWVLRSWGLYRSG